ncbi:MAG: glycosyltransferase [Anaerolineae bacterium]
MPTEARTGALGVVARVPHARGTDETRADRIALVHDWLNQDGGAEHVLGVMHDMYPAAPIYTTMADARRVGAVRDWDVKVSWMDRLPGIHGWHQPYLALYPLAWETTRVRGYDLVLSNKSGFCHGVRTGGAPHVCYCLTPTRYVWEPADYLEYEDVPAAARLLLAAALPALRRWDRAAADRVDDFVAISTTVQNRIARYYGRTSVVIHPPVEIASYHIDAAAEDFYLVLARLVPYKRIDLAVKAFSALGRRLVVVGDGRDRARLESLAAPTVSFAGHLPRTEVVDLLARSRGLVWPGVEDYGLAPVEAMASGRPVIARRAGGVLDTVIEGATGVFFDDADPASLAAAVRAAEAIEWRPEEIRRHAAQFGREAFEERLGAHVTAVLAETRRGGRQPGRRVGRQAGRLAGRGQAGGMAPDRTDGNGSGGDDGRS